MKFLANLSNAWSALRGKAAGPPGGWMSQWGGGPIYSDAFRFRQSPTPYDLVEAYKSLIYCCCNLNANGVARIPLRLYAITTKGQARPKCGVKSLGPTRYSRERKLKRLRSLDYMAKAMAHAEEVEEVTDHPLLKAITNVNPEMDHNAFVAYIVMSLEIVGAAYVWPKKGPYGIPTELWPLPPHLVYPMYTSGSLVPDSFMYAGYDFQPNELLRFRRMSMKNPYGQGYGPAQAAIEYARLEDVFVSIQDDMLSNGPHPSLIVSPKDPKGVIGKAEKQRLLLDLNQKARGGRAGNAIIPDGAVDVKPISYSPTDLAGLNISEYDMERVANCFDVPISMLKTQDVNRANAEAGLEQHGRNAVEPRCKIVASTLTRWTHSLDRNGARGLDRLFFAFDDVVAADRESEANLHKTYVDLGVISRDEVRLDLGYEPREGADELLVSNTLVPLGSVTAAPTEDNEATPGKPETEIEGDDDTETVDEAEETEEEADADAKALRAKALDLVARVQAELDRRKA